MKEKTENSTKRKKLLFWLILGAFLLIVTAITLGLIFGLRGNGSQTLIDGGQIQTPPDEGGKNPPDEGNNPPDDGGNVDTSSQYEFIVPIREVNLIKSHEFNWDNTMKWFRLHQAMDFGAPAGTEVLAAVDGKITSIVTNDVLDYAVIKIEHANNLTSVYKFIDPAEGLEVGQSVSRGQVIGTVATAAGVENEDGDHLHFEVWKNGEMSDPDEYLNLSSK